MIEDGTGNLLTADVDALVNTVNTVGVMGKGIALQFKRAYPGNYASYRAACEQGEVRLGQVFVHDTGLLGPRRYIVNFPTKRLAVARPHRGHPGGPCRTCECRTGTESRVDRGPRPRLRQRWTALADRPLTDRASGPATPRGACRTLPSGRST